MVQSRFTAMCWKPGEEEPRNSGGNGRGMRYISSLIDDLLLLFLLLAMIRLETGKGQLGSRARRA